MTNGKLMSIRFNSNEMKNIEKFSKAYEMDECSFVRFAVTVFIMQLIDGINKSKNIENKSNGVDNLKLSTPTAKPKV